MDPKEKIYYCSICAMSTISPHPLSLGIPHMGGELVVGYCRLCGIAAPYVGYITREELEKMGVTIPTLEELSEQNV